MGKLSTFLAHRKDMEFDFGREVRAVCDVLRGVHLITGREHTLSFMPSDGYVAEGQARAILMQEMQTALRDVLVRYLHNLCFEGGRLGLEPALFEEALRSESHRETLEVQRTSATITPITAHSASHETPEIDATRQVQDALSTAQAAA